MPLTKRQKYMGGVMLLAAGAFFWDRAHSVKPAEANPAPEVLHSDAAPASTVLPAANSTSDHIASRLSQTAKDLGVDPLHAANAFTLPSTWSIAHASPPASATAASTSAQMDLENDHKLAEEFVGKHHLEAVMSKNGTGYAIVDGRTIQIGQSFDHFKLTNVSTSSAVFQRHRVQVNMRLDSKTDVHLDGSTIDNRPVSKDDE